MCKMLFIFWVHCIVWVLVQRLLIYFWERSVSVICCSVALVLTPLIGKINTHSECLWFWRITVHLPVAGQIPDYGSTFSSGWGAAFRCCSTIISCHSFVGGGLNIVERNMTSVQLRRLFFLKHLHLLGERPQNLEPSIFLFAAVWKKHHSNGWLKHRKAAWALRA